MLSRSTRSIFTADASNFNRHFFLAPFSPHCSLSTQESVTQLLASPLHFPFSAPTKKTQLYICAYPHLISTLLSPIRVVTYSLIICHFLATRKLNPPPSIAYQNIWNCTHKVHTQVNVFPLFIGWPLFQASRLSPQEPRNINAANRKIIL